MKCLVILSAVLALALAETYSDAHDNIDVEALVNNEESLRSITACFVDKGDCTENAAFFKKDLDDATKSACAKCTQAQKHMLKRYLEEVKKNYPKGAELLKERYDPEDKYIEALREAIKDA